MRHAQAVDVWRAHRHAETVGLIDHENSRAWPVLDDRPLIQVDLPKCGLVLDNGWPRNRARRTGRWPVGRERVEILDSCERLIDKCGPAAVDASVVLKLAAKGNLLIRGYLIYCEIILFTPFRVRICAPLSSRAHMLTNRLGIADLTSARREIARNDATHFNTIQKMFGVDRSDADLYATRSIRSVLRRRDASSTSCAWSRAGHSRRRHRREPRSSIS